MRNEQAKLATHFATSKGVEKATRDGFGEGVVEAGKQHPAVVVLSADLKESTRAEVFEKAFPTRFIEVGVAEQAMATIASGMAKEGKIPFITSYAAFSPGRNYEQIRTTICLNNLPVVVCGMHAGVSVGPDGATHQMLEDMGMMRMLPNMTVVNPGDSEEARKATLAAATLGSPVYLRFGRAPTPVFTTRETPFMIGKALTLLDTKAPKVAILSTGAMSAVALVAGEKLEQMGIETLVVHVATVKPLDDEAVLSAAKRAGRVITLEEHQIAGGFGGAVAELLAERQPTPLVRLGIRNMFGQSGTPEELLAHYRIDATAVTHAAEQMVQSRI